MTLLKYVFIFLFLIPLSFGTEYTIKNKGIVDVVAGKIISNKYIHVKNNKIISIDEKTNSDAQLIDLSDSYILPGLFDCHAHLFLAFSDHEKNKMSGAFISQSHLNSKLRIKRAKNYLLEYLKQGFTSVCDLGNSGQFLDVDLKKQIQNNSDYPTLYVSGPALTVGNAQYIQPVDKKEIEREYNVIENDTDIEKLLTKYLRKDVDILKIILDGTNEKDLFPEKKLEEILNNPIAKKFKKITFHSTSLPAFDIIKKYKLKNIEHLSMFRNEKTDINFVTNTIISNDLLNQFKLGFPITKILQTNLVKYIHQQNIKPIFGPDFYVQKGNSNSYRATEVKRTILTMSEYGMNNLEIIQSMTVNPALSLGLQDSEGQIRENINANLIAVKQNPLINLDSLINIQFIMKNGKIIKLN